MAADAPAATWGLLEAPEAHPATRHLRQQRGRTGWSRCTAPLVQAPPTPSRPRGHPHAPRRCRFHGTRPGLDAVVGRTRLPHPPVHASVTEIPSSRAANCRPLPDLPDAGPDGRGVVRRIVGQPSYPRSLALMPLVGRNPQCPTGTLPITETRVGEEHLQEHEGPVIQRGHRGVGLRVRLLGRGTGWRTGPADAGFARTTTQTDRGASWGLRCCMPVARHEGRRSALDHRLGQVGPMVLQRRPTADPCRSRTYRSASVAARSAAAMPGSLSE